MVILTSLHSTGQESTNPGNLKDKVAPFRLGAPAGIKRAVPNGWSTLVADIENPTALDVTVVIKTQVESDIVQYGRQFWLPPNSRRVSWYPVRFSAETANPRYYQLATYFIDRTSGKNHIVGSLEESRQHLTRVLAGKQKQHIAIIADELKEDPKATEWSFEETAPEPVAARLALSIEKAKDRPPSFAMIPDKQLPTTDLGFAAADCLIVSSSRVADDPATLLAIRNWVLQGGKLMLLLPEIGEEFLGQITEDLIPLEILGKTRKTNVHILTKDSLDTTTSTKRIYDKGIIAYQVFAEDVEITHELDGWPAMIKKKVGRGEVWVSTIEGDGWLWTQAYSTSGGVFRRSPASFEWMEVAEQFLAAPSEPLIPAETFNVPLSKQIGFSIISRNWIIVILGVLSIGLFAAGCVFAKQGKLERMLVVSPVSAFVATAILLAIGMSQRTAVEPTLAIGQIVQVTPGTSSVQQDGLLAFYSQDSDEEPIGGNAGGQYSPKVSVGQATSMVFIDHNKWRWENLRLSAGTVAMTEFHHTATRPEVPSIIASFGPDGLKGTIVGEIPGMEQAFLSTPTLGNLAVELDGENWTAGDVLGEGEYQASTLVDDKQRRRKAILDKLFEPADRGKFPRELTFLTWATPDAMGFHFPIHEKHVGDSLVTIPVQLTTTPSGTDVLIPAALAPYRSVAWYGRSTPSPAYNLRRGWLEQKRPFATWLGVKIPDTVMPLKITSANVSVNIDAPGRTLQILGTTGSRNMEPLATHNNPLGEYEFEITQENQLQLHNGFLVVGINVDGENTAPWHVKQFHVEIRGRTE